MDLREMLMKDFLELCGKQFETQDFDAVMPLYLKLSKSLGLDREQRLWLCLLYMAFYNEGSGYAAFKHSDIGKVPNRTDWIVARNRRNLWGGRIVHHLESLCEEINKYGSIYEWLTHDFTDYPTVNWRLMLKTLRSVWGNGRWAIYTCGDLLHKVGPLYDETLIPDVENEGSSGPRHGLTTLYGEAHDGILDAHAERLLADIHSKLTIKIPYLLDGYLDFGILESILCDWSGMVRGMYYSGRNIDRMQRRITAVETDCDVKLPQLWMARRQAFDHRHLGEIAGWVGIRKSRLKHYQITREVLWSHSNVIR